MKNWKTTLTGIAAILAVVAKVLADPTSLNASDVGAVIAGIGLLTAKDHNVTGGAVQQ
jgi:hypothetical protein